MENSVIKDIRDNIQGKKNLAEKLRQYIITKDETVSVSMDKYNEYLSGVLIKDMSSIDQINKGVTVLSILVNNEVDFSLHMHENQSQTICVVRGKILDLENNIMFEPGESFFVKKGKQHRLRYYSDTELIVVYMPALPIKQ
jgi:mannose-6-phosphate isomerase-like protein (cupin superfamily)